MKTIGFLVLLIVISSFKSDSHSTAFEYDVAGVYLTIQPPAAGTMILNSYGNLEEIDKIFVPTTIEDGTYDVQMTMEANGLYKIEGTDYYIKSVLCIDPAVNKDAVLKIENYGGFSFGSFYLAQ